VKQADAKNIESSGEKFGASLVHDLKGVLMYLDDLLEALPEEKVEEFAESEHFDTYKRLFSQLGLA
jgi:molecular chaperone GrpE (heat shock protein)